jgi:hypothetical protein
VLFKSLFGLWEHPHRLPFDTLFGQPKMDTLQKRGGVALQRKQIKSTHWVLVTPEILKTIQLSENRALF